MILKYSEVNNINSTILRFFNIFGPKSNAVIGKFLAQKIQKKKITIFGNGLQKRDFLHVDDVSNAILKVINNKKSKGKIYNLGSGKANSILDIIKLISAKDVIFLPKRADDIEISISNISKIARELNWKPHIKLSEGIRNIIKTDLERLKNLKIPSINSQRKLILKFNKKK